MSEKPAPEKAPWSTWLAVSLSQPADGSLLTERTTGSGASFGLHSNIGYVLQSPHLFSGTIEENIRYGRLDATDEEVPRCGPKPYPPTRLWPSWKKAIKPMLVKAAAASPPEKNSLFPLPEPLLPIRPSLSWMKPHPPSIPRRNRLIQKATEKLLHGRTSFIIAHRLSTIRHADLILVVRDGKIIEQGRHEDLLDQKGVLLSPLQTAVSRRSRRLRKDNEQL